MAVCLEQQWACFQKTPGNNWGGGWGWGVGGESATEPASHKWQVLKREVHQKQNWSLPAAQLNYHSASYNFTTFHGRLSRTAVGLLSKTLGNNLMVKMNLFDQTDWEWIIDCGCGGLTYFCRWVSEMLSLHNSRINMPCQPRRPPPPQKKKKKKKEEETNHNKQTTNLQSRTLYDLEREREREGKKHPWIGVRLFH